MKIGLFVHKIHQFEPDTGQNTHDRCDVPKCLLRQKHAFKGFQFFSKKMALTLK